MKKETGLVMKTAFTGGDDMVLRFALPFWGTFQSTGSFCWCLLVIWISAVRDFFF
jgi:hypothetical protein